MNRIVIDLDQTLCIALDGSDQTLDPDDKYRDATPIMEVIEALKRYRAEGFAITIHTARNMRTFAGDIAQITRHTLPLIEAWLNRYDVPYDEIVVGKPWCGPQGFYVDDRAVRPSEFASMSPQQISTLLDQEKSACG